MMNQSETSDKGKDEVSMMSSPTTVILSPPSVVVAGAGAGAGAAVPKKNNSKNMNEYLNDDTDTSHISPSDDDFQLTPSSYPLTLESFIQLLPDTIRSSNHYVQSYEYTNQSQKNHDHIATLFRYVCTTVSNYSIHILILLQS